MAPNTWCRCHGVALFAFVKAHQTIHAVRVMCLLKVSPTNFYAWAKRPMSARERSDIALTARIPEIYRHAREKYRAPNIHAELADDQDIHVGRKRVAQLMRNWAIPTPQHASVRRPIPCRPTR